MSRVEIFIPEKYKNTLKYRTKDGIVYTRIEKEKGNQREKQADEDNYVSLAIEKQYQKAEDGTEIFECNIPLEINNSELDCEYYFKELNLSDETKLYLEFRNISLSGEEFRSLNKIMDHEINSSINKPICYLRFKEIMIRDEIGIKKKLVIIYRIVKNSLGYDNAPTDARGNHIVWTSAYLHFLRPKIKNDLKEIHIEYADSVIEMMEQMMKMNENESWNFLLYHVLPQMNHVYNYDIGFYEGNIECADSFTSPSQVGEKYYLSYETIKYDITGFLLNKIDGAIETTIIPEEFLERYRFVLQKLHDGKIQGFIAKASFMGLIF